MCFSLSLLPLCKGSVDELLLDAFYFHHDGLGSTVALTDSTGFVVESYTYDVYGQPSILSATYHLLPTSSVTNRFLFTGREYLAELGLYDYRHRFYSPSLGRFLQTDPLRFDAEDVNLYRFIENSPVDFIDPDGLSMTAPGAEVWHPMAREGTPEQAKFWGDVVAPSVVLAAYTFAAAPWLLETVPLWWDKLQEILKKCPETAQRALRLPATDTTLAGTRTLGYTTPNGNIFLQPGLSRAEQLSTLRHESVHAFLSARGNGPLATFRQNVGVGAYRNSQLLRFTEEAIAETYGSGSLLQGLRHPFVNGYVTPSGVLLEGSGLIGAVYLGYQLGMDD